MNMHFFLAEMLYNMLPTQGQIHITLQVTGHVSVQEVDCITQQNICQSEKGFT